MAACVWRACSPRRSRIFSSSYHEVVNSIRFKCTEAAANAISIQYNSYGDPGSVLSKKDIHIHGSDLERDGVVVKMLAAPVNPADINMIQGTYPIKPNLPATAGNEGVGEIVAAGSSVIGLSPGDWVIPAISGWGTWTTHKMCPYDEVKKIDRDIDVISAATLSVNPCTAYRMLVDFEQLQEGDTVIQNGANSAVGQCVIQIAAAMGLRTVNIVRDRPDFNQLEAYLTTLGATHVVTEETVRKPAMKSLLTEIPKPRLAFNCVGGKSATELLRHLADSGSMVTYGGMSKQPVVIPTGSLIFKNIKILGYWMTKWNTNNRNSSEAESMLEYLCSLIRNNRLKPPSHTRWRLWEYQQAVQQAMEPLTTQKQILVMTDRY